MSRKIYNKWIDNGDGTRVLYYKEPQSVNGFKRGDVIYIKGVKHKIHSFGSDRSCIYYKPRKDGKLDRRYGYYHTKTTSIFNTRL